MIGELALLIEAFPGAANQTRCFLHIINLVAKSVLRQFESPNARHKDLLSNGAKELAALAEELEGSVDEHNGDDGDPDEAENDNEEEGEHGREGMSDEEIATLEDGIQPVQLVLAKVSVTVYFSCTHESCDHFSFARSPLQSRTLLLLSSRNGTPL
jgi:hypothetical protein